MWAALDGSEGQRCHGQPRLRGSPALSDLYSLCRDKNLDSLCRVPCLVFQFHLMRPPLCIVVEQMPSGGCQFKPG